MTPLLYAMPGNEQLAKELAAALNFELGVLESRRFPDGEAYVRLATNPNGRSVAIVCTLDRPDTKFMPLIFASATSRELGAKNVGLIAPYLAYMRQDRRFKPGEAVTSRQVARIISSNLDWLVTVEPHLHRYGSLAEIYTIPTKSVHAARLISDWIKANIRDPVIIGPDSESEQWVAAVAGNARAPYSVLDKTRHGDRNVEIRLKGLEGWQGRTPVLVDDIISSGQTMIEAVRLLAKQEWRSPVCIAVHGLFADKSDVLLTQLGARVVTSNTVPHPTNALDVGPHLAAAVRELTGFEDAN